MNKPADPTRDGGLVRLRLDLAYDGTEFSGWARQPGRRTVQQTIEDALVVILRLDHRATVTVAGRTDAGVHATRQVAHVDLSAVPDLARLRRRLAGVLPDDVLVRDVSTAPAGFHARYAALRRRYRYRIADGDLDPVRRRDTARSKRPLDPAGMHEAGQGLLGEHDFVAYCKPRKGATTIRTLLEFTVSRDPDGIVIAEVAADAFCHKQVRSMVGALLLVGEGRHSTTWPAEVLQTRVRDSTVTVAPARGLTLIEVSYPPDDQLAARALVTRARRLPR